MYVLHILKSLHYALYVHYYMHYILCHLCRYICGQLYCEFVSGAYLFRALKKCMVMRSCELGCGQME